MTTCCWPITAWYCSSSATGPSRSAGPWHCYCSPAVRPRYWYWPDVSAPDARFGAWSNRCANTRSCRCWKPPSSCNPAGAATKRRAVCLCHLAPGRRRPPVYHCLGLESGHAAHRIHHQGTRRHTSQLPKLLQTGTPVTVEGPYGCFDFDDRKPRRIWIGAGIGITRSSRACSSWRRPAVRQPGKSTCFTLQRNFPGGDRQAERRRPFPANVRLHILVSSRTDGWMARRFALRFPTWQAASVWFCGPPAFGRALSRDFGRPRAGRAALSSGTVPDALIGAASGTTRKANHNGFTGRHSWYSNTPVSGSWQASAGNIRTAAGHPAAYRWPAAIHAAVRAGDANGRASPRNRATA